MKVRNIGINANVNNIENKSSKNKLDFSNSFNQPNPSKTKEELQLQISKIKQTGDLLVATQNYTDVIRYKGLIKDYLKSVVDYVYDLNKNNSFWDTNYFTTVNTVNENLEEITKELIYNQKQNIDLASKIDEINGLLVDIYM